MRSQGNRTFLFQRNLDIYPDPVHQAKPRCFSACLLTTFVFSMWLIGGSRLEKVCYGPMEKIIGGTYIHNLTRSRRDTLIDVSRQRRSLTPGFSIAAIRKLTSIFYDSAYKVRLPSYRQWSLSDINVNSLEGEKCLGSSHRVRRRGWSSHRGTELVRFMKRPFLPSSITPDLPMLKDESHIVRSPTLIAIHECLLS